MKGDDFTDMLELALLEAVLDGTDAALRPRVLSDEGSKCCQRTCQLARRAQRGSSQWRTLPSNDPGKDLEVAPEAQ